MLRLGLSLSLGGATFHTLRLKAATGNIDAGTVRLYQKV